MNFSFIKFVTCISTSRFSDQLRGPRGLQVTLQTERPKRSSSCIPKLRHLQCRSQLALILYDHGPVYGGQCEGNEEMGL